MVLVDVEGNPVGVFPADPFCGNRLQIWNYVTGGFLGRTAKLREVGGWRELETLEDWDLHVRVFRAGGRFKPAPDTHFLYRQVPGSRNRTSTVSKEEWQQRVVGEPPRIDATFYYQATPATTYWRCQVPARHLPGQALQNATLELPPEGGFRFPDHRGDAAIFQFSSDQIKGKIMLAMEQEGIRTLIEADDNYLDVFDVTTRERAGWKANIGEGPFTTQGHRLNVERANGVIVTTPTLADVYRQANPNVFVCRNSIDLDDWPEYEKPDDGVLRIGWFASMSHWRDRNLVRPALSWASKQPDVQVITMGYNPNWEFPHLHIPWTQDMAVYRRMMRLLDVGVAPILLTEWAVCRSDLKALEYAVSGALPVLSMVPPYDDWRDKPALFAHSAKDFQQQIKWCVQHRDDVRQMAAEAREYVLAERLIQHEIPKWREAIAG
jgi:hypothetical protein